MISRGIDVGFRLGWCLYDGNGNTSGTVSAGDKGTKNQKLTKLLTLLKDSPLWVALEHSDIVVLEYPFNVMGNGKVLLEILGIIKYKLMTENRLYTEIAQMTLKKFATGTGAAKKSDMALQAYKEYGFEPHDEDIVDAFWCAMVGQALFDSKFSAARRLCIKKLVLSNQPKRKSRHA
jgi:Holliday junction resolvasome RuvABC endonuclease subunit